MPRFVDPVEREQQIVTAAIQALSEGGLPALTLRKLAQRMGGSITLITHYFPDREALLRAVLSHVIADSEQFLGELAAIGDPHERLRAALRWFMPLDAESQTLERARVVLTAQAHAEPIIQEASAGLDPAMRAVLTRGVSALVPPAELGVVVDVLRVWVAGMAMSVVEHPEIWTVERQLAALDRFAARMAPAPAVVRVAGGGPAPVAFLAPTVA